MMVFFTTERTETAERICLATIQVHSTTVHG
jgi:hypothetical protein